MGLPQCGRKAGKCLNKASQILPLVRPTGVEDEGACNTELCLERGSICFTQRKGVKALLDRCRDINHLLRNDMEMFQPLLPENSEIASIKLARERYSTFRS